MALDGQSRSAAMRKAQDPLLDQNSFSVERLPSLAIVFDQFAASLAAGVAPLCRSSATFAVEKVETASLFETLGERQGLLAAVLHCAELDARGLVLFDRRFVGGFTHSVFGGDASERREPPDRPYTKIEANLIEKVSHLTARAFEAAFAGFAETPFVFERQETLADTQILGRRDMPMIAAHIRFAAPGAVGGLVALFPQTALLPMRQKLSRDPSAEAAAVDPRWAKQMKTGVSFAQIPVKGVLEDFEMNLGEVAELKVGAVLKLRGSGMGRVRLECGGRDLFWCKLGQKDGRYTLEIEDPVAEDKGLLGDLFAR